MGFGAGIYVYPRLHNHTYEEIVEISYLLDYEHNNWAMEHFKTAKEYAEHVSEREITITDFEDYKPYYHQDEYGYWTLYTEYGSWCSNGIDTIHPFFKNINCIDDRVELTQRNIIEFMEYCYKQLEEYLPENTTVHNAFIYDGDDSIKLIPCSGVEVQYEDGRLRRIETSGEYGDFFGCSPKLFDEREVYAYREGIRSAIEILKNVDWENSLVYYCGGW